MDPIADREIKSRLVFDNPWWDRGGGIDAQIAEFPERRVGSGDAEASHCYRVQMVRSCP
jgi:hypothetical protein